jgi:biopolymer transport protein ExbB/TolQ
VAVCLLLSRSWHIKREKRSFDLNLLGQDHEALLLPDDALEIRKRLKQVDDRDQRSVLVQLLSAGLQRARANWSAEDCGEAIKTQAELIQGQIEAGYSIIRYLAWAIPSIGFIGTVLGIGYAMGSLQGTKGEDMMTAAARHLSMAFDTTFVALVLSLILMFILHRVQAADDGFLVRATDWCMRRFVFRMHIPKANAT